MESNHRSAAVELLRRQARLRLIDFVRWCWQRPEPFRVGRHTRAFCAWFDAAVAKWERGESSYCLFNCPPRHGKSELCNYAVAFFLGRLSSWEPSVIYTGYGASLVQRFSRSIRSIIDSHAYAQLFPAVALDKTDRSIDSWAIKGSHGRITATGLGGALTGKGGHLLIVDDYCKSSEEAESETMREKTWEAFSTDLFTRQMAPAAIVVVTATPWHVDDVSARIRKRMAADPDFPRFDDLRFPAMDESGEEVLFPELYSREWYVAQRATNGPQKWAALFLCSPVGSGSRLFRDEWFNTYGSLPSGMRYYIFCDTAGVKKRKGNDYLVMWVIGLGDDGNFYVADGIRDRLNLSERADVFFRLVKKWHPTCTFWEQVGAQTDLEFIRLEMDRRGWRTPIQEIGQSVTKTGRILWLQPLFEGGRIWFPAKLIFQCSDGHLADLCELFRKEEFDCYPTVAHDDMLDCLANLRHPLVAPRLVPARRVAAGENYRASRRAQILS